MVEQTKTTQLSLAEGVTEPRAQTHAGPETALSLKELGRGHYRISWVLERGGLAILLRIFSVTSNRN